MKKEIKLRRGKEGRESLSLNGGGKSKNMPRQGCLTEVLPKLGKRACPTWSSHMSVQLYRSRDHCLLSLHDRNQESDEVGE